MVTVNEKNVRNVCAFITCVLLESVIAPGDEELSRNFFLEIGNYTCIMFFHYKLPIFSKGQILLSTGWNCRNEVG